MRALVAAGAAWDTSSIYFLAWLSPGNLTIQVRVADTCLNVDDTVVFAGVVRALVASLITDLRQRVKVLPVPSNVIMARLLDAARGRMQLASLLSRITPGSIGTAGAEAGPPKICSS
ncbi:hypothetical protein AB0M20_37045 [Actinoplanes sp. NPDC051633]|uniref:hypothetical protein n=1 Tax=Actinoplanes sp. NPDC051633 TaxID=3155670 RepID=UPI00342C75F0